MPAILRRSNGSIARRNSHAVRGAAGDPCCSCGDVTYYPLLYCPDGTEETGQTIALTTEQAAEFVGKVVRVEAPNGEGGTICAIVGDTPVDPDDYEVLDTPAIALEDCDVCCPAEYYQQAYVCGTGDATGRWLLASDVQPGKILKVGGGETGEPLACYHFGDCEAEIPEGDELIDPLIIRGWFDSCGSCECDPDYNKLIISVSQDDIDCCQQNNEFSGIRREMTRGSAAGTWEIPITGGAGSITTTGPQRKIIRDTPTPFPTDCTTGLQSVDPACCDDPGTTVYDSTEMRIAIEGGQVVARTGFGIGGIFDVGCILWSFTIPSCDDVDNEDELIATAEFAGSGAVDCSRDDVACPGAPSATATIVLQWAA